MVATPNRQLLIRNWVQEHSGTVLQEAELQALGTYLRQQLLTPGRLPLARLAELAHSAGAAVRWGDLSGREEDHLLHLGTLVELEAGLRALQERLEAYQATGNRDGVEACRAAARRQRRRALWVAENPRVTAAKRTCKQEMADWLLLWLEMPTAFFDWLSLRQRTPEYRRLSEL